MKTRDRATNLPAQLALAAVALLAASCAQAPGVLFGDADPNLTWPPPPEAARIRYVGQIATSADLKPGRSGLEGLSDFLFGEDEPQGLVGPRSVVRTRDGRRLWVCDPGNHCLHILDLEDRTDTIVDRAGETPFQSPVGLCLGPGDSVFACDSRTAMIFHLDAITGEIRQILRLPVEVFRPAALGWHEAAGELYVVDAQAHDVKVLDSSGALRRVLGRRGTAPGQFNFPCDLVVAGDRIWVADAGNQRVQAIGLRGEPISSFGRAGDSPGDLALPKGVALDSDGNVYVVDARFENVQVFDPEGRLLVAFGEEGSGPARFWLPSDIHIDSSDRIWICDGYNRRIQVFDYLKPSSAAPAGEGARKARTVSQPPGS